MIFLLIESKESLLYSIIKTEAFAQLSFLNKDSENRKN